MNDEELVEVIAKAWELPYEVGTALTHNWTAEGVQILKERFTRDILAALRSAEGETKRLWMCRGSDTPVRLYLGKWCDHQKCGWVRVTEEPKT